MTTHTGHLLIADISGYTQFLTSSEQAHADPYLQSLLTSLLEQVFEIHQVTGEEVIGINHIAFKVDDVNTAYDALAGYPGMVTGKPGHVPDTGRTNLSLRDPDGWRLQLVQNAKP